MPGYLSLGLAFLQWVVRLLGRGFAQLKQPLLLLDLAVVVSSICVLPDNLRSSTSKGAVAEQPAVTVAPMPTAGHDCLVIAATFFSIIPVFRVFRVFRVFFQVRVLQVFGLGHVTACLFLLRPACRFLAPVAYWYPSFDQRTRLAVCWLCSSAQRSSTASWASTCSLAGTAAFQ